VPVPLIHSREVPQANAIARVQTLAKLLLAHDFEGVAKSFPDSRDRSFYFQAARLLGFVEGKERLTLEGRRLATAESAEIFRALAAAFTHSAVGSAWLHWAGVDDVRRLEPQQALTFLTQCSRLAPKTQARRASTLTAWMEQLSAGLPALANRGKRSLHGAQLRMTEVLEEGKRGAVRWPPAARFPHNEDGAHVREVVGKDLSSSSRVLIVSGYSSLDRLIAFLGGRAPGESASVRLLLGTEPFPARGTRFRRSGDLGQEIRDYWLRRGVSVLLSGALIHAGELLRAGTVAVRTAKPHRAVHAKIYVADDAVSLGSSNYTSAGFAGQSEGNVRFTRAERKRSEEARALAEGLWTRGADYSEAFLSLLDALLRSVSWQEALARACASILEGDWARRYLPASLIENASPRLWRHQLQGISQAMWVLENVGSALVADATGSGKTRMGAWLIRGAFDRQYRLGFVQRPSPLILTPPQVGGIWERALAETGLTFKVESHGPLSNARAARHEALMRHVGETELLVVDEAHNFVNRSSRTLRLVSHYAENAILFTATPINRGAADLLALVELLGADNLSDASLDVLGRLRRGRDRGTELATDFDVIRREIRRFTVRRTRGQLNEIADAHPDEYRLQGRQARYPQHVARYYLCTSRASDDDIALKISALADQLSGVTRVGRVLRLPPGLSEATYVRRVVASARALARHHVMDSLRSSRAALLEHVLGSREAMKRLGLPQSALAKKPTGDMATKSKELAGQIPQWRLCTPPAAEHAWLQDVEAHDERAREDERIYREIGALAEKLSGAREEAKINQLARLLQERDLVIGFDSHVISLVVFEAGLRGRSLPVELLTGEGGAAAKRRAVSKLGLAGTTRSLIALCTDAFSEGLNLQRASCVVHLDTPTVIRLAEQRAGRVDRMDSPHEQVEIWWPKDAQAFAPQRRDLLRQRHEVVRELIGANLSLPEEQEPDEVSAGPVSVEELADRVSVEAADRELDARRFYDAFRSVRELVSGEEPLVAKQVYEHMRTSQAEVVACVSVLKSSRPWCFLSIGGLERVAPRWVFMDGFEGALELDLSKIASALRARLAGAPETRARDDRSDRTMEEFVRRLRDCEHELLPFRRRRALGLLDDALVHWIDAARAAQDHVPHGALVELREWLCLSSLDRTTPFPDPGSVADAWLRLLRPRLKSALEQRRSRRRPWRLGDLLPELIAHPIPVDELWRAFDGVQNLAPVDERILALIVGVDG